MGKNWAIAIGINHYYNLQSLEYAKRDAEAMQNWFQIEAGFDQVFLFTEDSQPIPASPQPIPTQPSFANFYGFLEKQFERPLLKPEDNLWFFFAGHGRRYKDQDYLMFLDSAPTAVDRTAISVDYVTQRLRRSGADNVILFIDACRDEEGSRSGLGIGQQKHYGVITFYSCAANQKSWEIDELQHGSFTHSLLEGLRLQGEANCATVERLEQHLRYHVPRLNTRYRKSLQNPYLKAEPPYKMYYILLDKVAILKDAEPLKYRASQAENNGDFKLAKQLWKRVLALPGVDEDAWEAIERITRKQGQFSTKKSNHANSSTVGTRTTSETAVQRKQKHQQNLLQYRNSFSQAVEQEFPPSKESRKRLRSLQQYLQLTDQEVSQIEQPIIAPKEDERRRQEEQEKIRKQQEAEQLRQQRQAEKLRKREARKHQQKQQLEKFQQLFTSITSRRQFLQWVGLGGGGLAIAVVAPQMFKGSLVAEPEYIPPTEGALWMVKFETVMVNAKGEVVKPNSKKEAKFFKEDLGNGVTLEMVSIPRNSFKMGSPSGEKGREDNEEPQHNVTVPAFFMGRYQVTQEQYKQVMGKNPSYFKGDKRPVERVSWNEAVKFCEELSKKTGRIYRLPSEAEWEYACRAGTTTPFYFGETITSELANYKATFTYASEPKGEYRKQTTRVGQFPPNAFGLYDMHGNVWEWCKDHWHGNYKGAPTGGNAWVESNENDNRSRVPRGGCWYGDPVICRSADRNKNYPDNNNDFIGLRVVYVEAPKNLF